jgi:hypothetical protein
MQNFYSGEYTYQSSFCSVIGAVRLTLCIGKVKEAREYKINSVNLLVAGVAFVNIHTQVKIQGKIFKDLRRNCSKYPGLDLLLPSHYFGNVAYSIIGAA